MSKTGTIPKDILEAYNSLVKSHPEIERKGATMPYTSLNGHMFSFLSKTGEMRLRLAEQDRNEFLQKFDTQLSVQHGRTMKEYVDVPKSVLLDTATLSTYLQKSFDYVRTLKPKATKKKT